ncbi:hypothetical protein AMEX_G27719 [Astyanax mexicanus]|uniref:Uncharacterized protein n=1 Tax=Astyanax mexicanus TaxID=7994 RepID=A0A8T2KMX6_ASTMX|nr:hypothetical protein AMEX_G27719 [Astyanax mexicanus]
MPETPPPDDSNGAGITATFFIVVSLVVSLLPVLWCLRSLYMIYKSGGRKPIFITVLLINVLVYFFFSPAAIRLYLKLDFSDDCVRGFKLFLMAQLSGIFLHQLVALESVLSLRNPLYTTDLFSMPCSISLSVALYVFAFASIVLDFSAQFAFCLLSVLILILTVVFTFKAPPYPHFYPDTHKKTTYWILAVATVTMVVAYLPFLLTVFIISCSTNLGAFLDSATYAGALLVTPSMRSLRAISDAFLCVLVFKKVLPVQTAQTQAEPNALHNSTANSGGDELKTLAGPE